MRAIRDLLRIERARAHLTLEAAANKANLDINTIHHLENIQKSPDRGVNLDTVLALLEAYGRTPAAFFAELGQDKHPSQGLQFRAGASERTSVPTTQPETEVHDAAALSPTDQRALDTAVHAAAVSGVAEVLGQQLQSVAERIERVADRMAENLRQSADPRPPKAVRNRRHSKRHRHVG